MTENFTRLPSAAIWRRLFALVYDSLVLLAISMAWGALALALYVLFYGLPAEDYTPVLGGPLFQLGWYVSLASFYFYFWRRGGQTIGMRAWRLKLVGRDQPRPGIQSCLLRLLVAPPLISFFLTGYFWKWIDRENLCLHDRLSSTRVILLPKK